MRRVIVSLICMRKAIAGGAVSSASEWNDASGQVFIGPQNRVRSAEFFKVEILRLDPPIPLKTPLGEAKAHMYIDRGRDEFGEWVCFLGRDGTSWTFIDPDVRLTATPTDNRFEVAKFRNQELWDKLYSKVMSTESDLQSRHLKLASNRPEA
jgi:hypothetical protein